MNTAYQTQYSLFDEPQINEKPSHIAEVITPGFTDSNSVVLPIAASLSQQTDARWTTWITHRTPSKAVLSTLGADLSRLRIVHVKQTCDARWVIWQALAQGNSHTVIAEQTYWDKKDIANMNTAAIEGDTKGVFITTGH